MDVLTLSRAQFGFTIAFHYIFPPLSIGLGLLLVLMEGIYFFTRKNLYLEMASFGPGSSASSSPSGWPPAS